MILIAVRVNEKVSLRLTPLIFISTIITHLLGGSAGREGAALQIGGSIGSFVGRKIKLDEKDERIITMCGMSAGFAGIIWYASGSGSIFYGSDYRWYYALFCHCAKYHCGHYGNGPFHGLVV